MAEPATLSFKTRGGGGGGLAYKDRARPPPRDAHTRPPLQKHACTHTRMHTQAHTPQLDSDLKPPTLPSARDTREYDGSLARTCNEAEGGVVALHVAARALVPIPRQLCSFTASAEFLRGMHRMQTRIANEQCGALPPCRIHSAELRRGGALSAVWHALFN